MAVTAVTITSGPTVVGRSVTLSGTLSRDGGGTNNNLNFLCYSVGYVAVYTITKLSDSSTFYNASGTAGSGIAWTWTGTLPEGDYLAVTVNLNDAPYTTLATSASNVGLIQLRKPLSGIWTPNRDSRGLFIERFSRAPGYKDSFGANNYNRRTYHYATPDGQIYWSAVDNIARLGEYGNLSKAAPTPYGTAIDVPQGWEWPVGTRGGTSTPGGYSTSTITYVSLFYLHNSSKYHDPAAASKYAALFGESRTVANDGVGAYWSNANGEQAIKFGTSTFGNEVLQNITINGVGNGLHCLVIVQCVDARTNGHKVFFDGQLVGQGTYTQGYLGAWNIRPYYFWGSISKSGLDIGSILFQGSIEKFYASDEQAVAISLNPYSYFFRDAPKTTAKRRLFSGVLSLPDPPTEFTSTKAGRVPSRILTQQPQGAVQIDWSNPLARGITFAQIGNQTQDVVFNGLPTLIGSNNSRIDQYGRGFNLAGSNAFAYPNQSKYFPTTQVSVLSITRPATGQAANTSGNIFGRATTANSQAWGLQFFVSGFTTNGFTWNVRNSGGFSYSCTASLGDNYQYTRPFVVSGSAGTNQSGKLYVDGILKGTQVTPLNDTLYAPGSAVGLAIGSADGSTASYNGSTFLNVVWNRTLTDSEHLQLGQNPWQLFKPAAGRLYFLPATTTAFKGGRFLPQRWKQQPQTALTIDRGHSLSTGLCAAWHPGARQYIGPGLIPSPTPDTYAYQADLSGEIGVKFNGAANSRIALPAGSAGFAADYSGTRLVLFRADATTLGLVSGTVAGTIGMRLNGGISQISLVSASNVVVGIGNVPASSGPTVALCTANSASTQTRLHINGQLTFSGTASYTASNAGIWVGAITNHNSSSNFFLALSWDRALTLSEAAAIQENPWQIFKPNPGRIYFLPGATRRGKFLFLFS